MITPEQSRAARALLGWSLDQLHEALEGGLSKNALSAFERGGAMRSSNNQLLRSTFEDAGIQFIPKNGGGVGVRLVG